MAVSENPPASEFLVVALPERAEPGATFRLLGSAKSASEAEKIVGALDASVLGRVAILERRSLFQRRPAVESVSLSEPIVSAAPLSA